MDEPVWIAISVIAVVIGLGIIMGIFSENKENVKLQHFKNAFNTFETHCNYVCGTSPETISPVEVELPSGVYIYTAGQKICGRYEGNVMCAPCDCELESFTMDLNTTAAKKAFDVQTFSCSFKRGENEISIGCQS